MKKKILIIILGALIAVIALIIGLYFYGLTPVSKQEKIVLFNVTSGTSKIEIVDELKEAGLVKSKFSLYIYVALNRNLNLQAGIYELSPDMSAKDIIQKINDGKIKEEKNTFNLTFIEGKRLTDYAKVIAKATNTTEEEVLNILNDKEYLQELINEYWFLSDDILNEDIYYPLEGYLFASTYELYNNSSVKDIITKMLDGTAANLKSLKSLIDESKYSVHEILTMASITEHEGVRYEDRRKISQTIYNRLAYNDILGMDVTAKYAWGEDWLKKLYTANPYNTRANNGSMNGKLPVGPICNPSYDSIKATLNPDANYYWFVANLCNGDIYFYEYKDEAAFIKKCRELKKICELN